MRALEIEIAGRDAVDAVDAATHPRLQREQLAAWLTARTSSHQFAGERARARSSPIPAAEIATQPRDGELLAVACDAPRPA